MPDIEVRNIKENVPPKNYNGIDIVKFLCAILVFAIHIPPIGTSIGGTLSTTNTQLNFILQSCVCRIAVPFFFVCSGFFLFQKMEPNIIDINRIKNYCFKMLRLLGIWSVLLFWGGTGHLWYLGATVVAIAFLSILLHYNVDIKWLIVFAVALYALGLLGDSYFGFIKPFIGEGGFKYVYAAYDFIVGKSRNGFMMGYIFVLLGYLFAQGKFRIKAPEVLKALGAFAIYCTKNTGLC